MGKSTDRLFCFFPFFSFMRNPVPSVFGFCIKLQTNFGVLGIFSHNALLNFFFNVTGSLMMFLCNYEAEIKK